MSRSQSVRRSIQPAPPAPAPAAPLTAARPLLPRADEILPYLERIDGQRWYSNFGPLIMEFEARLAARFTGGAQVTTVSNATQGLTLALKAMDLEPGLIAIPSWTFVATAHAVLQAGLTPWMLDVDAESAMLEPAAVRARLASAPGPVRAVIPVAPHGQMVDLAAWRAFRAETGLPVLVDAAAAFDMAVDAALPIVVSLHATKAMGIGEGGFLATADAELAARFRELTTFGFRGSREARLPATNAKLSEYAGAVGLAGLDAWPATRRRFCQAAQRLRLALALTPEVAFQPGWGFSWVSSVCVVGLPPGTADAVEDHLSDEGVDTRRWWGDGCHRNPAFADLPRTDLANTEALARSTLGLPFMVDMTEDETLRVAGALQRALGG